MISKTLPLIALLAWPALAQERWQAGITLTALEPREWEGFDGASYSRVKHHGSGYGGWGIHAGCRVWDLPKSDLSVIAEHQFRTSHDLDGLAAVNGRVTTATTRTWRASTAPWIQWNLHRFLDAGLGLTYHFTRLETDAVSVHHNRPWAHVYLGYTFARRGQVRPYVALRSAVALNQPDRPGALANPAAPADAGYQKQMLRYLEGNQESSLQFGVRF